MFIIIIYGYIKKVDIYDSFINGVKESFSMIINLFPTFIAMILAVNVFINSGFLNFLLSKMGFIIEFIGLPKEIFPLALMRPISGSASLAYLNSLYLKYGTDSFIGLLGSVMQGATDTTLYVISLYLVA